MDHIISSEEWISYDMVFGEKCVHQTCIHINKEISFLFFCYTPKKSMTRLDTCLVVTSVMIFSC